MDKIICLGTNYAAHAKECNAPIPEKPVIFLKPPSVLRSIRRDGGSLALRFPQNQLSVHPECEIVLKLKRGGYRLPTYKAEEAIAAVTVGLDMTLRDKQTQLKKSGHPWTLSKVFPDSAIVGPWKKISEFPNYLDEPFSFFVDGELRQQGRASQMRLSPSDCIAYTSQFFPLCPGDLIFTGTPGRVHPIAPEQIGTLQWGEISYSVRWG